MKKTLLLFSILFIAGCGGSQVGLPVSDSPDFVMAVTGTDFNAQNSELVGSIDYVVQDLNPNSNIENAPNVFFSVVSQDDVMRSTMIETQMEPGTQTETQTQITLDESVYADVCDENVTFHAAINPSSEDAEDVFNKEYQPVEEENIFSFADEFGQEYEKEVYVNCDTPSEGNSSHNGTTSRTNPPIYRDAGSLPSYTPGYSASLPFNCQDCQIDLVSVKDARGRAVENSHPDDPYYGTPKLPLGLTLDERTLSQHPRIVSSEQFPSTDHAPYTLRFNIEYGDAENTGTVQEGETINLGQLKLTVGSIQSNTAQVTSQNGFRMDVSVGESASFKDSKGNMFELEGVSMVDDTIMKLKIKSAQRTLNLS